MITILIDQYNIDPTKVYMTGWSNGAMLTMRAVCELGDKIRAAAPYAGALEMKAMSMANAKSSYVDHYDMRKHELKSDFTV